MLNGRSGLSVHDFESAQRSAIARYIGDLPQIPNFDAELTSVVRRFAVDPPVIIVPPEIEPTHQDRNAAGTQLSVEYRFQLRGDHRLTEYNPPSVAFSYNGANWSAEKSAVTLRMHFNLTDSAIPQNIKSEIERMCGNFETLKSWFDSYNARLRASIEPLLRRREAEILRASEKRDDLRIKL